MSVEFGIAKERLQEGVRSPPLSLPTCTRFSRSAPTVDRSLISLPCTLATAIRRSERLRRSPTESRLNCSCNAHRSCSCILLQHLTATNLYRDALPRFAPAWRVSPDPAGDACRRNADPESLKPLLLLRQRQHSPAYDWRVPRADFWTARPVAPESGLCPHQLLAPLRDVCPGLCEMTA